VEGTDRAMHHAMGTPTRIESPKIESVLAGTTILASARARGMAELRVKRGGGLRSEDEEGGKVYPAMS